MRILFRNKNNKITLLMAIASFEIGSCVSIKSIRTVDKTKAILIYEETPESDFSARSKSYVGKTKR